MNEVFALLAMTVCGAALSAVFDMRRGIQKAVKLPDIAVIISDILFWIFSALVTVWCLKTFNSGKIGIYDIIGFILGSILYFMLLSGITVKLFAAITGYILKIFGFIFKILLTPIRFLYKIIIGIFMKINVRKKEIKTDEHNEGAGS